MPDILWYTHGNKATTNLDFTSNRRNLTIKNWDSTASIARAARDSQSSTRFSNGKYRTLKRHCGAAEVIRSSQAFYGITEAKAKRREQQQNLDLRFIKPEFYWEKWYGSIKPVMDVAINYLDEHSRRGKWLQQAVSPVILPMRSITKVHSHGFSCTLMMV